MIVTASVLNVRSGPDTKFSIISKHKRGDEVVAVETSGDWTRIEPCGWVASMYLAAQHAPLSPVGLAEIVARFGAAGSPAASAGRVTLPASVKLGWENSRVSRVACHVEMVEIFSAVFGEIYAQGLWSLIQTYDGIYQDRVKKGTGKASTHAWGISVDLNAGTNQKNPGDMPERLIRIFEKHGFLHGRAFNDPMHFQFARGY